MNPNLIEQQLREVFRDWDDLLINPRFCRHDGLISWTGYSGGKLKEPLTSESLLQLVETRQFSFQSAEDDSIFQLLYRFSRDGILQEARLGFYLVVVNGDVEQGNAEATIRSWLRFDYDLASAQGPLHHASHLHIHGFRSARLVVDGVPGPRQFVEFIMASCYPEYYKIHRLSGDGNFSNTNVLAEVNHCSMPGERPSPASLLLHLALPGN